MNKILQNKIKVIAVVGPTASGKTSYSIELAKNINGEIISADSRLVYRGFNIGTAKPTKAEMQNIPHYMIDIVEPEYNYSAGLFKNEAKKIIYHIAKKGKVPIITGGTGLYIDILLKNYELPQIEPDMDFRKKLYNLSDEELYNNLISLNKTTEGIDIHDRKKIIRAIEITTKTGLTLDNSRGMEEPEFDVEWIGRNYERPELYQRINKRVDEMIASGLVEETKKLLEKHGRIQNLTDTIGYREIIGFLDNKYSLEEAKEVLKQNTRRYAKRQLTWFRKNSNIKWNIYPEPLSK